MNIPTASESVVIEFISYPTLPFTTEIYAEHLTIDWGDGNNLSYDPSSIYFKLTYTYPTEKIRKICLKAKHIYSLKINNLGITGLSLKNCTSLEYLHCGGNELTELDISNCPHLEELHCNSNNLTEFQIPVSNRLSYLNLSYNSFNILKLEHTCFLQNLYCANCHLHRLDIQYGKSLNHLNISNNCLNTAALDHFFHVLPEKDPWDYATLYLAGNPGNSASFEKRRQSKGWY